MERSRILVVDDEPMVREVLARYLSKDGFDVEVAADGEAALSAFERVQPNLVLLDLMLPRLDGLEVFRTMRTSGGAPVIMLTARGDEVDRVLGLEMGADDYVAKPFSPREVVARVRAVLRRARPPVRTEAPVLQFADIVIDGRRREVTVGGSSVKLTPKEFDLLYFLASHAGTAFTRTQLLEEVWDFAWDGDSATITVHVRRLRTKLEADPARPRHLITVWGIGYRFDP